MRKPDTSLHLPESFRKQYRKNIAVRLFGSAVLIGIGVLLCSTADFSGLKYPQAGSVFIIFIAYVLACLFFRLQNILFKPSWMGTIEKIVPKRERRVKVQASTNLRRRMIVHLYIDRGEGKLFDYELWHEDMEHAGERSEDGARESIPKNKFLEEAPYKVGDTVVYLRGMRYPFRCGVETEGMFDVRFVCPFCGEINKAESDTCYHCRRTMVK
ncbi:MAG: hypothetical protein IJC71_07525 [Clostridia bacterium]|nr:hypothetical protein [Clostridia bacterium]